MSHLNPAVHRACIWLAYPHSYTRNKCKYCNKTCCNSINSTSRMGSTSFFFPSLAIFAACEYRLYNFNHFIKAIYANLTPSNWSCSSTVSSSALHCYLMLCACIICKEISLSLSNTHTQSILLWQIESNINIVQHLESYLLLSLLDKTLYCKPVWHTAR